MFDVPMGELSGRLTFGARPRRPEDLAGVDMVVNLLTDEEIRELSLEWLVFRRFPIPDRQCPPWPEALRQLLGEVEECLRSGGHVYIHCRAGIGRSGLVTACLLYRLGFQAVWETLERARGVAVPDTDEQKDWVERFRRGGGAGSLDEALALL